MLRHEPRIPPEYIYPVNEWHVLEKRFAPGYLEQSETIFALANGYLGIRGSFEEGRPVSQSGTFVNGFHETFPITYGERAFGFAETGQTMLDLADAKLMRLFVDDEPFAVDDANLLRFERDLDMKEGVLRRSILWETPAGKKVQIRSTRIVSFEHRQLAAIDYEVTLLDAAAPVAIVSQMQVPTHTYAQEGDPPHSPAGSGPPAHTHAQERDPRRARPFSERVLLGELQRGDDGRILLGHRARNSGMTVVCGVDHAVETSCAYEREERLGEYDASVVYKLRAQPGESFRVIKYMTYHTSRSADCPELADRATRTLERAVGDGWESLRESQRAFVSDFWRRSDVQVHGDLRVQQSVRWNLFQLLQASARAEGAGIGARGLTGLTYEGHYFWDTEIYVLPFLLYTEPRIARNLLSFRFGMLHSARRRAREVGEDGALFPWRTINGEEASAYYAAGTAQYHINADVVYALRKYVEMSGDEDFLFSRGAEVLVETTRLWMSLGFFSEEGPTRFRINAVTGPDEYNTVVNNNLFTNMMARHNLLYAASVLEELRCKEPERYSEVVGRTGFRSEEAEEWLRAAGAMYLPYDEERGIHLQDDSFLEKQPWNLEEVPPENFPLLLHHHPLVIYRHRVVKQADVVMALFLLGHEFTQEEKRRNFDFYDPLTTGDSSLSVCIQSIIAAEIGYQEEAYEYFRYAVLMDLADIGGNVRDGAHIAAIGGTWMNLIYGFAGMRDTHGDLSFDPRIPVQWEGMSFPLAVRGRELRVDMEHEKVVYHLVEGDELTVHHQGTEVTLRTGKPVEMPVRQAEPKPTRRLGKVISTERFDAVLFDMDGVLTQTAETHAQAWKEMFDEYLRERERRRGEPFRPFETGTDYLLFVDGKPRQDGVRDFLESRGIYLPEGNLHDSVEAETQWGLGNRKNERVLEVMRKEGVRVFPGSIRVVESVRRQGMRTAVVTASANAEALLEAAGVADLFDVKVDGNTALDLGLAGKPAPDTFLEAARQLGVTPERAVVVEDALAGVQAGRRGGFGLVLGVARSGNAEELMRSGAHEVVGDLGELLSSEG